MALRAGIGWAEFWNQTPYATGIIVAAYNDRARDRYELAVVSAFHTAYFSRMDKLGADKLEKALGRSAKPARQQTDHEMVANVFAWLRLQEKHLNGAGQGADGR